MQRTAPLSGKKSAVQIQEAKRVANKIDSNRTATPTHITSKVAKTSKTTTTTTATRETNFQKKGK